MASPRPSGEGGDLLAVLTAAVEVVPLNGTSIAPLTSSQLLALSLKPPKTISDLEALSPGHVNHYGVALLEAVHGHLGTTPPPRPNTLSERLSWLTLIPGDVEETQATPSPPSLVKSTCAKVMSTPSHVVINSPKLSSLASSIRSSPLISWSEGGYHFETTDPEALTLYVGILDSLNFCFWPAGPTLQYGDIAAALAKIQSRPERLTPAKLSTITAEELDALTTPLLPKPLPALSCRASCLRR